MTKPLASVGLCRPCIHIRSSRAPYRKQTHIMQAREHAASRQSLMRAPPALSRQQKPCILNTGSLGSSCRPGHQTRFTVLPLLQSKQAAACSQQMSFDRALMAPSLYISARTADQIPSAPTKMSASSVVPSDRWTVTPLS